MPKYICLLRGINVGGKNIIKMAELRSALPEIGWENAETLIQSGNIIFESKSNIAKPDAITRLIKEHWGYDVRAQIVSARRWIQVVANNPFQHADKKHLHLTLLEEKPKRQLVEEIREQDFGDDEFAVELNCIYLLCPNGVSRTRLTNNFFERKLKTAATTRNWNTVLKLFKMSSRIEGTG